MKLADIKDPVKRRAHQERRKREAVLQDKPMSPQAPFWISHTWTLRRSE